MFLVFVWPHLDFCDKYNHCLYLLQYFTITNECGGTCLGLQIWPCLMCVGSGGWWAVIMVVITCVLSLVLGIICGHWQLVVIILDWGGLFWAVVVIFLGSPHCHGQIVACSLMCHIIVVMVGGGCEQFLMVVGSGSCW